MMSDTDKKELEEHFSKQYLLIPKNGCNLPKAATAMLVFGSRIVKAVPA